MSTHWHSETAFKTVIGPCLLQKGYVPVTSDGFDREPAILPSTVLAFIRGIQPKERAKLESLHGDKTGEEMLGDLSKLMDSYGVLATLRHGFKEHRRTLHAACFKATLELIAELEVRCAARPPGPYSSVPLLTTFREVVGFSMGKVPRQEWQGELRGSRGEHA